jgi:putative toxin-antitoxin system antitoxin component (TIGR02293 family)
LPIGSIILPYDYDGAAMTHKIIAPSKPRSKATTKKSEAPLHIPEIQTYQVVRDFATRFDMDRVQIRNVFGVAERTQFRYEKENPVLKPTVTDRIDRFERILAQAIEVFEDEPEAQRWLKTPKVDLGNQIPLDLLATDAGTKQVEQMLYRAEYGMFG